MAPLIKLALPLLLVSLASIGEAAAETAGQEPVGEGGYEQPNSPPNQQPRAPKDRSRPRPSVAPPAQRVPKRAEAADRVYWQPVQTALRTLGYAVGTPDGIAGQKTKAAVRQFQASIGSVPSGILSRADHDALMRRTADPADIVRTKPSTASSASSVRSDRTAALAAEGGISPKSAGAALPMAPPSAPSPAAAPHAADAMAAAPTVAPGMIEAAAAPAPSDVKLDALAATSAVLGVRLGVPLAEATAIFAREVGSCTTTGTYTECSARRPLMEDRLAFAAEAGRVYFIRRSLRFPEPVPRAALVAGVKGAIPELAGTDDLTLTGGCGDVRQVGFDALAEVIKAAASAGQGTATLQPCRAAFAGRVGSGETATDLAVLLFDARGSSVRSVAEIQPVPGPPER